MNARPVAVLAAAAAAVLALPLIIVVLFLGAGGGAPAAAQSQAGAGAAVQAAGAVAAGVSAQANEALGAQLAAGYGWTGAQDTCLDELWTRESGWQATAKNPSSGAYGISQALGHLDAEDTGQVTAALIALNQQGDNYPSAEAAANPPPWGDSSPAAQITWGLGYIASSYGSPCAAWAHETADGFY